jgi:hypothetical protein
MDFSKDLKDSNCYKRSRISKLQTAGLPFITNSLSESDKTGGPHQKTYRTLIRPEVPLLSIYSANTNTDNNGIGHGNGYGNGN